LNIDQIDYLVVSLHQLWALDFQNPLIARWKNFTGFRIYNFEFCMLKWMPDRSNNLQKIAFEIFSDIRRHKPLFANSI
jgi:hypothetical protein